MKLLKLVHIIIIIIIIFKKTIRRGHCPWPLLVQSQLRPYNEKKKDQNRKHKPRSWNHANCHDWKQHLTICIDVWKLKYIGTIYNIWWKSITKSQKLFGSIVRKILIYGPSQMCELKKRFISRCLGDEKLSITD